LAAAGGVMGPHLITDKTAQFRLSLFRPCFAPVSVPCFGCIHNPYGDGRASERIAEAILQAFGPR
jgi:hypothetical protein